jgi:hypothetical protein
MADQSFLDMAVVAMITYDLDGAHLLHQMEIPAILDALLVKYPDAKLSRVNLFAKLRDYSIASEEDRKGGEISLNDYWFSEKPEFLVEASKTAKGWHCCLGREPQRVLTHEFGHCLADARPKLMVWAEWAWKQATRDPARASSGYALVNPGEYWAEEFAAYELGALAGPRREVMRGLLQG